MKHTKTFVYAFMLFATLLSVFSIVGSAFANSSTYFDKNGSTVFPIENKSIVMKKEVVKIQTDHNDPNKWFAECEFVFFNRSSSAETVTIGYPDWLNSRFRSPEVLAAQREEDLSDWEKGHLEMARMMDYGTDYFYLKGYRAGNFPYISEAWNLHDLKVEIDGNKVETTHKAIEDGNSKKPLPGDGAYIWKVAFMPYETKVIKVAFSFSGIASDNGEQATYILRTGALWADKIGEADIYWNREGRDVLIIMPPNYKTENNILHWHFENFEPNEDIKIITSYGRNLINDLLPRKQYEGDKRYYADEDLHSRYMFSETTDRIFVQVLRNEIFARHGREFESEHLKRIFSKFDWYKPNKDFSVDMLNEYEKKNIEFILKYEKQKGWR